MSSIEDPLIGTWLREKWRVDALLGQGGMATVYAATHRNGTRGAIKLLRLALHHDEELRARLVREGYVANKVSHPGVVKIVDDDVTEDGRAFLVMELLEGETWKARWNRAGRKLPADEVLRVAGQVLDVLSAAHAAGVIHRDVKPDNVFLTKDGPDANGGVKLVDFGIARFRQTEADQTQTGTMLGTPAFMSPEQALAKWSAVDARSDLFSVAATMWTLMTGRMLHSVETVPELLVAMATRQVRPFREVCPDASDALAAFMDRALRFAPSDRFATAKDMRVALDEARASLRGELTVVDEQAERDARGPMSFRGVTRTEVMDSSSSRGAAPRASQALERPSDLPDVTLPPNASTIADAAQPRSRGAIARWAAGLAIAAAVGGATVWAVTRETSARSASPRDSAGVGESSPVPSPSDGVAAAPQIAGGPSTPSASSEVASPSASTSVASASASASASVASPRTPPAHPPKTPRRFPPFARFEAERRMAERANHVSTACRSSSSPGDTFTVIVTFLPDGRVNVSASPAEAAYRTPAGSCAINQFSSLSLGEFDGEPQTLAQGVTIGAPTQKAN